MKGSETRFLSLKSYELKMSGNILDFIELPILELVLVQHAFLCVRISIDISYQMQFSIYFPLYHVACIL